MSAKKTCVLTSKKPSTRTRGRRSDSLTKLSRDPSREERGRRRNKEALAVARGGSIVLRSKKKKRERASDLRSKKKKVRVFDFLSSPSPHSSFLASFSFQLKREKEAEEERNQNHELPLHQPARRPLQGRHHPPLQGGLAARPRGQPGERGEESERVEESRLEKPKNVVEPPKGSACCRGLELLPLVSRPCSFHGCNRRDHIIPLAYKMKQIEPQRRR